MAENFIPSPVTTFTNDTSAVNTVNNNFTAIQTAFTDVLSRSGVGPNQMGSSLDMNNNQIINLPSPSTINSPARLVDVVTNPTITVPSSGTALSFIQTGTGATTRTVDAKLKDSVFVSVTDFGATGNGSTDDTTAIQNAINSLPTSGGVILFPVGNYKVTATLTIGNGTSSQASTRMGVVLRGMGNPNTQPIFPGFTATSGPKITWAGGTNTNIISVNGPLQGWGVQNLYIDGSSTAGIVGLNVTSAQFGDCQDLTIVNCAGRGIVLFTVPTFGSFTNTDCFHNKFENTNILVPAVAGSMGILLTGGATSNADYNTFVNTYISLPTGGAVSVTAIFLQVSDSNVFYNTQMSGGNASAVSVAFDYSILNSFPSSNTFIFLDPALGAGTTFTTGGSPGASARSNYIWPLGTANNAAPPTVAAIPNLVTFAPGQLTGTNTNDSAIQGYVGEYLSGNVVQGSAVALTTGTPANITSITLTPGDWDVTASIGFIPAATTNITLFAGSMSTTSATNNLVGGFAFIITNNTGFVTNSNPQIYSVGRERFSVSVNTTVFLVSQANFTVSTMGSFGRISARRVR